MNKKNMYNNEPSSTKISNLKLSKIPMSTFRNAESQAIKIHDRNCNSNYPISYKVFCSYINKWEQYGEHSYLFEIALPLFSLSEDEFWKGSNNDVYLNLFSDQTRSNGKWMKKLFTLYKKSTSNQQILLSAIFRDVFDVSLDFIVSENFSD